MVVFCSSFTSSSGVHDDFFSMFCSFFPLDYQTCTRRHAVCQPEPGTAVEEGDGLFAALIVSNFGTIPGLFRGSMGACNWLVNLWSLLWLFDGS